MRDSPHTIRRMSLVPRSPESKDTDLVTAIASSNTSYPRRLLEYAIFKLREHKVREALITTCIGAIVGTGFGATFSFWGGLGAGLGTFTLSWLMLFVGYLFIAPRGLDKRLRTGLKEAEHSAGLLEAQLKIEQAETERLSVQVAVLGDVTRERDFAQRELAKLQDRKVVVNVVRAETNIYRTKHDMYDCPVVKVQLGLDFRSLVPHDIALEGLWVSVWEKGDDNVMREMPMRGAPVDYLFTRLASPLRDNFTDKVPIKGLVVEGYKVSPLYYFIDKDMYLADFYGTGLLPEKHFVRVQVRAVAQKPYQLQIEVPWNNPGRYIGAVTPVEDEA